MFKKLFIAILPVSLIVLAGCEQLSPGLTEYTLPEEEPGEREVTESSMDELTSETHEPYTLDSSYLASYGYNPFTFKAQSESVIAGMSAAQKNYYAAEAKYAFWSDFIDAIDMDGLVEEFYSTQDSLYDLINLIAKGKQLSLAEYAAQYSMSEEDLKAFLAELSEELSYDKTEYELLAELETDIAEAQSAMSEEEMSKYKELTGDMLFTFDVDLLDNNIALFSGTEDGTDTDTEGSEAAAYSGEEDALITYSVPDTE